MAPDAGSSLLGRFARFASALAAALLLGGCAAQAPDAGERPALLAPVTVIVGGLGAAPATPPGFPAARKPPAAFVKLMFPSAIAAAPGDIFVADSGLGALLRIDPVTHAVSALRSLPVLPGVRLAAAPDGTVYLLRPERSEILRLARDGRTISTHGDIAEVPRPVAIATEPNRNTVLIADASGEVYAFGTLNGPAESIPGAHPAGGVGPRFTLLASGLRWVTGYDADCRCLVALDREEGAMHVAAVDALVHPTAMIADDYDRLWVADAGDRLLKVFENGEEIARMTAQSLGLTQVTTLSAHHQRLYVADGPGGRIAVFDILPPQYAGER